jgi:large subunit ribosomal protein L9
MKVILLEKIQNLGKLGDEIEVKPGFARNYLFPKYKAVLSNKKNRSFFEKKIQEIEKNNNIDKEEANKKKDLIESMKLEMQVKTSDGNKLFGSVTNKNIAQIFEENNISIEKNDIEIEGIINKIGEYDIKINLKNNVKMTKKLSIISEKK